MNYTAPLKEQRFVLDTVADLPALSRLPAFEAAAPELVEAVLAESARLAEEVFAPLNRPGDVEGAAFSAGEVTLPSGFVAAYRQYVDAGWGTLAADPAFGGQGLPFVLASAVQEQLASANLAFSLCMLLTQGAIEALSAHASEELKRLYLARLVSGEWTGTMNLTEPQAGSDVGALRTHATPVGDGSWRIKGQKIFITWGEHDAADNIVHMVLARTPGAPPGTKGISLFLVPKRLVNGDGTLGRRNDLSCVAIEHKLGIHASPTCTMSFGDNDDCVGYLVGQEQGGMRAMFTMMNHARIGVGLQGVAIAERAYQGALAYARERVQGKRIIEHADVRRMLLTMKALTEAIRALAYCNAAAVDRGHAGDSEQQALADLLTPVTKAFATDMGVEVAGLGIQVFGGMGYIEETGAAQHWRDARIAPIYEGTNGIQAIDLVARKLPRGRWPALLAEMREFTAALPGDGQLAAIKPPLEQGIAALGEATGWLTGCNRLDDALAGATPYLRMFGMTMGGYLLARQAAAAEDQLSSGMGEADFLRAKIAVARFFAEQILPQGTCLLTAITRGADPLYDVSEQQLAG